MDSHETPSRRDRCAVDDLGRRDQVASGDAAFAVGDWRRLTSATRAEREAVEKGQRPTTARTIQLAVFIRYLLKELRSPVANPCVVSHADLPCEASQLDRAAPDRIQVVRLFKEVVGVPRRLMTAVLALGMLAGPEMLTAQTPAARDEIGRAHV